MKELELEDERVYGGELGMKVGEGRGSIGKGREGKVELSKAGGQGRRKKGLRGLDGPLTSLSFILTG